MLSPRDFSNIVKALNDTFDLSSCEEFTVECNPESVTEELAEVWGALGVNRISMGVQTFGKESLSRLGRLHSAEQAKDVYALLRRSGFKNINLDLMIALPGQTEEELRMDLEEMLALCPEHLSVYMLKVEADSVFGRRGVRELKEEQQRSFYLLTHRLLTAGGYEHYEISNFARSGFRARHNCVYWCGGEYLAFGAGASGYWNGVRYRIPEDTMEYCNTAGLLAPIIEERIDGSEAKREAVFLGLRLSDGIDLSLISQDKIPFIETLCREGLGNLSDHRFALTPEGFLVSDYVMSELLPER